MRFNFKTFCLVLVGGIVFCSCAAKEDLKAPPQYDCFRVKEIKVDGNLDDPEWRSLPEMKFQRGDGKKLNRETKVKMAWNNESLFLAAWITDEEIIAKETQRDGQLWNDEAFEIFLKPNEKSPDYGEFEFNALGTCLDVYLVGPRRGWWQWDSKLVWKVTRNTKGWQLETSIPFKAFLVRPETRSEDVLPQVGRKWRANLFRIEKSGGAEYSMWSFLEGEDPDFHQPDKFGYLLFREEFRPLSKGSKANPSLKP